MIGHLLRSATGLLSAVCLVSRNIHSAGKMTKLESTTTRGICIRGMRRTDEPQVLEIDASLNGGERLSLPRRVLYRVAGDKLVRLAVPDDGPLVGLNMYYFNKRDVDEGTIHSAFIGVLPAMTRRGVATAPRLEAGRHFAANIWPGFPPASRWATRPP